MSTTWSKMVMTRRYVVPLDRQFIRGYRYSQAIAAASVIT